MLYSRYTRPRRVKMVLETSKEIYDYLQDLCCYYRIPSTEVIESLICVDHEQVTNSPRIRKKVASSINLDD